MFAFRQAGVLLGTRAVRPSVTVDGALEAAASFCGAEGEIGFSSIGGIARATANGGIRRGEVDTPSMAGWAGIGITRGIGGADLEAVFILRQTRVLLGARTTCPCAIIEGTLEAAIRFAGGEFEARAVGVAKAGRRAGDAGVGRRGIGRCIADLVIGPAVAFIVPEAKGGAVLAEVEF